MGVDIGHGFGADGQVVGGNAGGDGGKEGIGGGIVTAQPDLGASLGAGPVPDRFQPCNVIQNSRRRGTVGIADPQVHWAMAAQGGETGVHFGSQNPRDRAGAGVCGPQASIGVAGGKLLGDGDGFGDDIPLGGAHGGGGFCRVEPFEKVGKFIGIQARKLGLDGNAKGIKQQPAAQGPRGIGAVADDKIVGHGSLLLRQASRETARAKVVICAGGHHER